MVGALTFGVVSLPTAVALFEAGGGSHRSLAFVFLLAGGIALPAGIGDRRVIRAGGLRGAARLRRHLWRMCLALLIVVASFVLGRRLPDALHILPVRLIPLVVLVTMSVWLWRLRQGPAPRAVRAIDISEAI